MKEILAVFEELVEDIDEFFDDPTVFSGRDVIATPNPGIRVAFAEEIARG